MTPQPLAHERLAALGLEHGFGVRGAAAPADVWRPQQVHGCAVARATPGSTPPEADAVVSDAPGLVIGVVTADCVPLLLAARDGTAVAAVHAGWRGLALGVVEAGVSALAALAGPAIVAVVGPHVGPCCYEVDAPVLDALAPRFAASLAASQQPTRPGHARLDLGRLARAALAAAGVADASIGALQGACTACDAVRFHSYRRDGAAAGRLLHFISASPA